eukprot:TRINITY_DN9392_c0_g2_i1.p1 TRINITY_DN9392_c0_g2~~TRINITY_DN9392_c0_g2_i1.p1  ORF type:complete len:384 (+),score=74.05 TRINITY_DN9392_c0_g2_i1:99-1154(+)
MEHLWKDAFPVGTEWEHYDKVYDIDWDFSHLEAAFEPGGLLHGQKVWIFGCTEPQMLSGTGVTGFNEGGVHIPAVVAVVSPFPPSDKLGIKSVQMVEETVVSMREMKMDWVPFFPEGVADRKAVERFKASVFVLKCAQRRASLKRLKEDRLRKYQYCLPYIFNPDKDGDPPYDTTVQIMYTFDDDKHPPVVSSYDWKYDEEEDFLARAEEEEGLPHEEREKFWAFCKEQANSAKAKIREERAERKRMIAAIPEAQRAALRALKVYKYYPQKSEGAPDIAEYQSEFINRYYGKADAVFPPVPPKKVWPGFSKPHQAEELEEKASLANGEKETNGEESKGAAAASSIPSEAYP